MTESRSKQPDHWLALQSSQFRRLLGVSDRERRREAPRREADNQRPDGQTSHHTNIQLERLTGIHERHVVGPGETPHPGHRGGP